MGKRHVRFNSEIQRAHACRFFILASLAGLYCSSITINNPQKVWLHKNSIGDHDPPDPFLGSTIQKINFYKSIPLPLWDVHGSTPLLDPPWNRRHSCCLHRNIDFSISRDAKFIFKISCSTLRTEWNLIHSQILSRVVVVKSTHSNKQMVR